MTELKWPKLKEVKIPLLLTLLGNIILVLSRPGEAGHR